jgi:hypothetical protein
MRPPRECVGGDVCGCSHEGLGLVGDVCGVCMSRVVTWASAANFFWRAMTTASLVSSFIVAERRALWKFLPSAVLVFTWARNCLHSD